MLLVKTYVAPSLIHGLGLFAGEFIAAGEVVWEFTPGIDFRLAPDFIDRLPATVRESLLWTYNFWSGGYGASLDNSKFINHSKNATLIPRMEPADQSIAARDISIGEELTEDYEMFDLGLMPSALTVVRETNRSSLYDTQRLHQSIFDRG